MTRVPFRPLPAPVRHLLRYAALLAAAALLGAGAGVLYLQSQGVTPRALGPYLERRSSGHNPWIEATGTTLNAMLTRLDRGAPHSPPVALLQSIGAGPASGTAATQPAAQVTVSHSEQARAAFASAAPGTVITFAPGAYRMRGRALTATVPGTAAQPITVRAAEGGTVILEIERGEGFKVAAPYWRFENLTLRGVCRRHAHCEHAFHVVGNGHHFVAFNNMLEDFNAHFKINGERGAFPDHGLIEGNTLRNSSARQTRNPVTPVDLVAASHWTIRRNYIADFIKAEGDRVSYGAFAKGAGANNTFEQNIVWCEQRLQGLQGQRIGLSLGGGATGKPYCRDRQCITEQQQSVIRNNLIAGCSDVGIYLNSAARSSIVHNTLVDTAGIDVRFPTSSADVEGNLIDGPVRSRDGGIVRMGDNLDAPLAYSYLGYHPQRGLFTAPQAFDFGWAAGKPPARAAGTGQAGTPDLCGMPRPARPAYGAFEDFSACRASATTSSSKPAS